MQMFVDFKTLEKNVSGSTLERSSKIARQAQYTEGHPVLCSRGSLFILALTVNLGFACSDLIFCFAYACQAAEVADKSFLPVNGQQEAMQGYTTDNRVASLGSHENFDNDPQEIAGARRNFGSSHQRSDRLWDQVWKYQNDAVLLESSNQSASIAELGRSQKIQSGVRSNRWRADYGKTAPATIQYDSGAKFSEL